MVSEVKNVIKLRFFQEAVAEGELLIHPEASGRQNRSTFPPAPQNHVSSTMSGSSGTKTVTPFPFKCTGLKSPFHKTTWI